MTDSPQPDPAMIGGVPQAPFVLQHAAAPLFQARAARFRFLARTSELAAYLEFLADLTGVQAQLAETLPAPVAVSPAQLAQARAGSLPPINRAALADDPQLQACLEALCVAALPLAMPAAARTALEAVHAAGAEDRRWLLDNVLGDEIPADATAPHLFAAATVQVFLTRLAAALPAEALVPVATGVCPACGGRPVTSSVIGLRDIENVRYASCAGCATQWNEVRVKCLCCGSTRGISYRSVGSGEATVKAEACSACGAWVKILYQVRNASLDPVADDVGTLGLDLLMRETGLRRGGFSPYLAGY